MTPAQSAARLILYVLGAMLGSASACLSAVNFSEPKQVAAYFLGILTTGVITARSYIDKSPSEVIPPPPQPRGEGDWIVPPSPPAPPRP